MEQIMNILNVLNTLKKWLPRTEEPTLRHKQVQMRHKQCHTTTHETRIHTVHTVAKIDSAKAQNGCLQKGPDTLELNWN